MVRTRAWILAVCVLVAAFAALAVAGCDTYEPESSENEAVAYYQDKYHEKVELKDSHGLGNYNLFGYTYSGMEYLMSDGASVIYLDDEGVYRDNRQTVEVRKEVAAFAQLQLDAIPGTLAAPKLVQVGDEPSYETYAGEGECWHAFYDGDVETFLQAELPQLLLETSFSGESYPDGRFGYEIACDPASARAAEGACLVLARYFDIRQLDLLAIEPAAFEQGGFSLFDDAVRYVVKFQGEDASSVSAVHFKPVFVPLLPDAKISSGTPGVTLAEGDVAFVPEAEGFYRCRIQGEAAQAANMSYYILDDGDQGIVEVLGPDRFSLVCNPHEHRDSRTLIDGARYYLGNPDDIAPQVEIEEQSGSTLRARYHTHFKDQIEHIEFRAIGLAQKSGSSHYETVEFKSRIVSEIEDGWIIDVAIPQGAKPDNEIAFQFTYNDDENVTVQIMKDIVLE